MIAAGHSGATLVWKTNPLTCSSAAPELTACAQRRTDMTIRARGVVLVAFCAMVAIQCGGGLPGREGPPVADVYARMSEALARAGEIAVVTEVDDSGSANTPPPARTMWLDLKADRARIDSFSTYYAIRETARRITILSESSIHHSGENGGSGYREPVGACRDPAPRVLTLYLNCSERGTLTTVARTDVRFDGRPAVVLVTRGKLHGIDSTISLDERLYIDAETYLPIARVTRGTDSYALGGDTKFSRTIRFMHTFVPRDTLPPDFFDASQASYEEGTLPFSPP